MFVIEPLARHSRDSFRCGVEALDHYLQRQVGQDTRRGIAACFVAVDRASGTLAGFYTISATHVQLDQLDPEWRNKLPRYPFVPAARLGRLAVDQSFKGKKLGTILVADAVARSVRSEVATHSMIVDAKDDDAAAFYRHHGFRSTPQNPLQLCAPLRWLAVSLGVAAR